MEWGKESTNKQGIHFNLETSSDTKNCNSSIQFNRRNQNKELLKYHFALKVNNCFEHKMSSRNQEPIQGGKDERLKC